MNKLINHKGMFPYISVVFLNAFVDLGHKIVIQNTIFKIWDGETQVILTAVVNALILLPFILLFSPAGFLSDRFSKHKIIRYGALSAVGITLLITLSYYMGWFWMAFGLTLMLAIQSAVYSPAKYGYIRELVGDKNLAEGNALVQAVTIISILLGTFAFSIGFEQLIPQNYTSTGDILESIVVLGWLLVGLSLLEYFFSLSVKRKYTGDSTRSFRLNEFFTGKYLKSNVSAIISHNTIWLSIVGLSIFWAISQVVLAAFPAYAKEALQVNNTVVIQGILACTGVGIMLGSVIAGKISRSYIEIGLIPISALGVTAMLLSIPIFQGYFALGLTFALLGMFGGMFIVPLNALIQYSAKEHQLGTILAGNNWVQNIAMLSFLGLTVLFSVMGFDSVALFYMLAAVALAGAVYTVRKLPHSLARILVRGILKRKYKLDVVGFENMPKEGAVLMLGNHISWIDWAVVQIACPRPVRFVMARSIYNTWYLKPLCKLFGAIPISQGNSKTSLEKVNEYLKDGEVVCLFPEGAISHNGHLGEFKTGYERTIDGVDGVIVPFYLRGLWGSLLSRSKSEKLRGNTAVGIKRDIIVAFGEPLSIETKSDVLKQKIFELSIDAWDKHTESFDPLPLSWLKVARKQLAKLSLIDSDGKQLTNAKTIVAVLGFAKRIRTVSPQQNVGLMLPSSSAAVIANLAVALNGQTAVNLNYTSSVESVVLGIDSAEIETIYTSSAFVEKLAARGIDVEPMLVGKKVVFLEELRETIPQFELLRNLLVAYLLPASIIYRLFGRAVSLESPAQILFSSGSEGVPKGIVLSHRNIMGNIKQISAVLNTQENDVVMASLPPFHSFGLTVTSLMPMIEGIPAVCHPDPTDALPIARAVAQYKASIICGTATFLRLYTRNKKVHPLMFESLRIVVAGAEKLSDNVRYSFESKFKKEIFEGYGATETTPVASVNMPDKLFPGSWKPQVGQKPGTVGLPLPGSCFRIVDPDSMADLPLGEDGLILISGSQVMKGYLNNPHKTADVIAEIDGRRWYKTGDKGHLDTDGFLTIVDRYSRFAKIGGEMVSLAAVEKTVRDVLSDEEIDLAAVNLKDEKKGEKVVLLVQQDVDIDTIRSSLIQAEVNPLMIPATCYPVAEVPKLGSGKTDFSALKNLALALDS